MPHDGGGPSHYHDMGHHGNAVLIAMFVRHVLLIAAYRIAYAAHRIDVPWWEGTHRDELRAVIVVQAGSPAAM